MTKAFLEPIIIRTESEKLIMNAFSQKSLKKVKIYNSKKRDSLKQVHKRVLSVNDIF
ncbi:MAG: hypothetical protein JJV94_00735 [Sulfurospirillum sp.]|nr:hypothetical protein [Sulfurospirillum sp.]